MSARYWRMFNLANKLLYDTIFSIYSTNYELMPLSFTQIYLRKQNLDRHVLTHTFMYFNIAIFWPWHIVFAIKETFADFRGRNVHGPTVLAIY